MLSVEEALRSIDLNISQLDVQERLLLDALGQVAAEDIYAQCNVPDWPSAAMDGYAVQAGNTKGASFNNLCELKILESVNPGYVPKHAIIPGKAIHVTTGAMLPQDADCVIRFEDTDETQRLQNNKGKKLSIIGIQQERETGNNVKKAGENIVKGSLVIARGQVLGPAEISILASLGYTRLRVISRPKVAIIATGDELIQPGKSINNGQLYSGSAFGVAAQVLRCGGIPGIIGIARDKKASLIAKIRRALNSDAIITTGGISVRDNDLIRSAIAELGEVVYWQVNMSPGKPFTFALVYKTELDGKVKNIPHFAMAGNAPSSLANFQVLVRPAILKMAGKTNLSPPIIEALIDSTLKNTKKVRRYIWVKIENRENIYHALPLSTGFEGVLTGVSSANGLAVIPENRPIINKGEKVQVMIFNWHGEDI